MNKYIKTILIISGALSIGLLMGYLLFGNNTSTKMIDEQLHSDTAMEAAGAEEIWTCSMHPQIRQNEPGECPICGMDLIPLAANSSNDPLVLEMTNEAVKLAVFKQQLLDKVQARQLKHCGCLAKYRQMNA